VNNKSKRGSASPYLSFEKSAEKTAINIRGKPQEYVNFSRTRLQTLKLNPVTSAPCSETASNILLTGQNCDVIVH